MHLAIGIYRIFPEQIKPHRPTGSRKQEQVIVNAEASATYFPTSFHQITDHEVTWRPVTAASRSSEASAAVSSTSCRTLIFRFFRLFINMICRFCTVLPFLFQLRIHGTCGKDLFFTTSISHWKKTEKKNVRFQTVSVSTPYLVCFYIVDSF